MKKPRRTDLDDFDDPQTPLSVYEREDEPEPWFLPDPDMDAADIPLPQANRTELITQGDWTAAQGAHAAGLARAALAVGQLDMLIDQMGPGAQARLALREVEALSWGAGSPVSVEEIGRDQLQARAGTDVQTLRIARWAARRLTGDGSLDDLRSFLALHRSDTSELAGGGRLRMTGTVFDEAAAEFAQEISTLDAAHEITRGAFARHLWRMLELSPEGNEIEGAVWAARTMAGGCQVLNFVPLGQGARRLRGTGPESLGAFFRAVEQGATGARAELMRLRGWASRAQEATARIKGDNPARIIDALMAKPMATTEMIEEAAGISRDTAERLLARMQTMGLVREVTGARRFRIWAAAG